MLLLGMHIMCANLKMHVITCIVVLVLSSSKWTELYISSVFICMYSKSSYSVEKGTKKISKPH